MAFIRVVGVRIRLLRGALSTLSSLLELASPGLVRRIFEFADNFAELVDIVRLDRALRFRVDAMMELGPDNEKVQFDAVLQLNSQNYMVR